MLISCTGTTYFITLAIIGSTHDSEKRARFHAALPIRPAALAIVDVLFVALFQLGIILFWATHMLLQPGPVDSAILAGIFSGVAIAQSAIALMMINSHLRFLGEKMYRWLVYEFLLFAVLALAALQYAGVFMPVMRALLSQLKTFSGAVVMNLIWLGLSTLSVILFMRRKSYLA